MIVTILLALMKKMSLSLVKMVATFSMMLCFSLLSIAVKGASRSTMGAGL